MTQTALAESPAQLPARSNNGANRINLKAPVRDSATLKGLLESAKGQIADVLPRHLTPERMIKIALVAAIKTPKLLDCTAESILQSMMQAASLGLDPGGALGSAYLVPYGTTCQLIPGYRGLIDLARRTDTIDDLYAHCVYKNDFFEVELGAEPKLVHRPNLQTERLDEDIVGAYMVAFLKDRKRPHIEFMPRCDIDKVRRASKTSNNGPWKDWFSEMCRKSAVKRGIKYLPISVELAEAIALDDRVFQQNETRVLSASTGDRTQAVLNKITSRPVSESQQSIPDDSAVAQAEQELQQEPSGVNTQAGEVAEPDVGQADNPPEPSEIGNHAGKAAAREVMIEELSEQEWPHFYSGLQKMIGDKVSDADFKRTIGALVLRLGKKGKESDVSKDAKKLWATAALDGRIDWSKGVIMPAASA